MVNITLAIERGSTVALNPQCQVMIETFSNGLLEAASTSPACPGARLQNFMTKSMTCSLMFQGLSAYFGGDHKRISARERLPQKYQHPVVTYCIPVLKRLLNSKRWC